MNNLKEIAENIKKNSNNILLCGHVMPDGDSLGSIFAMGLALEKMGKEITMAGPDPVPEIYGFLPGSRRFMVGGPPEKDYDTVIALDCSVPERMGKDYQDLVSRNITVISIDHHVDAKPFGLYNYLNSRAAAVGEIIYNLLILMNVKITMEIAINIYTAIATDTGSFRYDNTTPETHTITAKLLETGLSVARINTLLFEEKPREALSLLGHSLQTLSFSPCGRVCWMTTLRETISKVMAKDEYTDELANYTRMVKGVKIGLLFREISKDFYKVSFRSKDSIDVSKLASSFGGGGHPRAAGCVIKGDLIDIQKMIISAAIMVAGGLTD